MIYLSQDHKYKFRIEENFVVEILKHVKRASRKETGGILIGNYSPDHNTAILTNITGPPADSRHGSSWFERGLSGLQELLDSLWCKREFYLGEWHFHPLSTPNPSFQDVNQMKSISNSKAYHCPEPILLIIGGTWEEYQLRVFIAIHNKEFKELILG